MPLFQSSVLKKYLKQQNHEVVGRAYRKFAKYFLNPVIQENIRNSKEEQFQATFLTELFVNVLGYSINPSPKFNLSTEYKNEKNNRKADAAILHEGTSLGVIELKGTKTKDLESIRRQAFDYKANHKGCVYVITSNFEKLRFYINDATDFEEFDLFALSEEEFQLLYLCLKKENLTTNIPLKIKEVSLVEEEKITKSFYADYSVFKRELHRDLVKKNGSRLKNEARETLKDYATEDALKAELERTEKNVKLSLFKKSQKLIDRFLFVFFAEDRGLLPPNSTVQILDKWDKDVDFGDERPLYGLFKQYFNFLDTGRKGTASRAEIYAYNGGLFQPDATLDGLTIDDTLLSKHTRKLANYDFESQVDVNILGHIFENSLNEIESINVEIEGGDFDKQKSKRKKDGVFYTPKYITKYIVENTVGKLCEEKKAALGFQEDEYFKGRKNRNKKTIEKLVQLLDDYRDWLMHLTICDPPCGSGAFLNQALDFLIKEHRYIDELKAKVLGGGLVFADIENTILENNIYGVDLNEESVEIAKLSLWLRTAQPRRKLNDLSSNIKCGNSLIDDKKVAGAKAFHWQTEFPTIFKEKDKKPFHIVTAIHDSRTSQRMIDYKVRENRAMGTKPRPQVTYLTPEDEKVITETVAEIVKEDGLNIMAYNICKDHMHLLLVCREEELSYIVKKIKGRTARTCNANRGINPKVKQIDTTNNGMNPIDNHNKNNGIHPIEDRNKQKNKNKGINPLVPSRTEKSVPLWTQKFGRNPITSEEQLSNTLDYIRHNRSKHKLPEHPGKVKAMIESFTVDYKTAFRTEHTGGFDVVIGNPPYVKLETIKEQSQQLEKYNYRTFDKRGDLYVLFVEKGFNILKSDGLLSYIMPNKWLQAGYGKPLRSYFLTKRLHELIDFGDIQIFKGATTYPLIFIAENRVPDETFNVAVLKSATASDFQTNVALSFEKYNTKDFNEKTWVISSSDDFALLEKLKSKFQKLSEFVDGEANYGIKSGLTKAFIFDESTKTQIIKHGAEAKDLIHPVLRGRDIIPWYGLHRDAFMLCTFPALQLDIEDYPSVKNYLLAFGKERLEQTGKKGSRKKTSNKWFETQDAISYYADFKRPKIMYQTFQVKPCFIYDERGLFCNNSMWIIPTDKKELVGVLNSKMGWWLITKYCTQIQNGCQLIWKYFSQIPIPELTNPQLRVSVEKMMVLTKDKEVGATKFQTYFSSKYHLEKLPRKLQNWHELDFGDFIKELEKARKKASKAAAAIAATRGLNPLSLAVHAPLTKKEEFEWLELFEENKKKAQELQTKIAATEKEIDQMVYELYGLTQEEIAIVEAS